MLERHRRLCLLVVALLAGCAQAAPPVLPASGSLQLVAPPSASPRPSPSTSALPSAAIAPSAALVARGPGEPDPRLTPGATNPDVTQATIGSTICVSGWTATVRPSSSYTTDLKREQIAAYGYADTSLAAYEEDHLIPLELGGAPSDPRNLWPEPYTVTLPDGTSVGARIKDQLENRLKSLVCAGTMPLAEAQHDIATDWVAAWLAYVRGVGPSPALPAGTPLASSAASAEATTQASGLGITILSVTSPVSRGARATVVARTAADAACSIVVRYKSGPSKASGLAPTTADEGGEVSWTWTVGSSTTPGTWPITIACSAGGASATATTSVVVG